MVRFATCLVLIACGCAPAQRVAQPLPMGLAPARVVFAGYSLYLRHLTLAGGGEDGTVNDLRLPLVQTIAQRVAFDAVSALPPRDDAAPGTLLLDVEVDPSHTIHRTWVLDGWEWGDTVVTLQATLHDAQGHTLWSGSAQARGTWSNMTWFRTGPPAMSYSETYATAFRDLAQHMGQSQASIVRAADTRIAED